MEKLHKEKIHTAVDTCGEVPWEAFTKVLPFTDMFLYDFKCADPVRHQLLTGCGNARIMENLRKLSECGKEISDKAEICVNCGVKVKNTKNKIILILIIGISISLVDVINLYQVFI